MHTIDEPHIFLFLVQMLVLLGVARTMGIACQAIKMPALVGEILTGILLGPTLLARMAPAAHAALFPADAVQVTMLDTVSWLGVFFLLFSVGFEVDVSKAMGKQGKAATSVGLIGVIVPLVIGIAVFWHLDPKYWGPNASRLGFSLFLAVGASITAITVVARVVTDLGVLKSDLGTLIVGACAVNDVFGWFLFTIVVAVATGDELNIAQNLLATLGIVAFGAITLSIGGKLLRRAAQSVKRTRLPETPALLTLITTVGLLCGIVTHMLGIHAILGFFLAGLIVGEIEEDISVEQREALTVTAHGVFVPIFFATIGIKIDFLTHLDLTMAAIFTVVAIGGKLFGAWLGAALVKVPRRAAIAIGIAFTPGGAMEIVVGMLAFNLGLISQVTFVAIVFAALLSSILVGPLFAWWLERVRSDGHLAL